MAPRYAGRGWGREWGRGRVKGMPRVTGEGEEEEDVAQAPMLESVGGGQC